MNAVFQVQIVENARPDQARSFAVVDSIPMTEIGVVEGDSMHQLFSVTDAGRLADGRLVLLNSGTREFRVFDASGRYLYSFGGPGDGPGEFGYVEEFAVESDDTIVTIDRWRWVVSWFASDGTLLRTRSIDRSPRAETVRLAPAGRAVTFLWGENDRQPGLRRADIALALIDSSGLRADTLGWFGAWENYIIRVGERLRANLRPFACGTYFSVGQDRVYIGDSERFEIQVFGFDAVLARLIRLSGLEIPVTAADRAAYERQIREWARENPRTDETYLNRYFAEVPWPTTRPSFGGLIEDGEGYLWVEQYRLSWETKRRYEVFDPDGVWRGVVVLPDGFEPLDIGTDYLVAKRTDELDVEYVGVYALDRL
jgi:hypothetical protein